MQYASHHSTYKDWSITVGSNISHIPSETHCVWCWGKASDSDVHTASPIHLALSPGVPVPCKTKQWPNYILSFINKTRTRVYTRSDLLHADFPCHRSQDSFSFLWRQENSVKTTLTGMTQTHIAYLRNFTCRLFSCCRILACAAFLSALAAEGWNHKGEAW